MGIYNEAPLGSISLQLYSIVTELSASPHNHTIKVPEGRCESGNRDTCFLSEGYSVCSGLLIRDPGKETFALFHIVPSQQFLDIPQEHNEKILADLTGGTAVIVEGSESTRKISFISSLMGDFGIKVLRSIPILTQDKGGKCKPFHLVYRPSINKVLVARISHQDILTYKVF